VALADLIQERKHVELLSQAVNCHQQGDLANAAEIYRRILARDPRNFDALHLLGVIEQQRGRPEQAITLIRQAIELAPNRWAFHANLACALDEAKHYAAAIECYRRAIELGGESATLVSNLGATFHALGNQAEAEQQYRRAISLDSKHAEAHYNLGNLLREAGQIESSIESYDNALRLNPQYSAALGNLANLLLDQGRVEESLRLFARASELDPGNAEWHYNHARALKAAGRYSAALASYEKAIALAPDHAAAHMLRGLILLRQGKFSAGWQEYEWRWKKKDELPLRELPQPQWRGEPTSEQTLFIYSEQGVGDELMFASCLPDAIRDARHCVIECDPRLTALYRRSFPTATVHSREGWYAPAWLGQVRPIDCQTPIGNLPRYHRPTLESFPHRNSYLQTDPAQVAKWRQRLNQLGPGLKIGISWRGRSDHEEKYRRSIPLGEWRSLLTLDNVHFVNLQYGDVRREVAEVERELGIELHDWEDADPQNDLDGLAAQMAALDLVVTIGNTNAHLAGAIGAQVWTLLPHSPSWRWMDHRQDSLWYPTMRLLRQRAEADWPVLINAVRDAIVANSSADCLANANIPPIRDAADHQLKRSRATISDVRWRLVDANLNDAFARGVEFAKAGEPHHAEGIFREILRLAPKHVDALHRLGMLLKQSGRRDDALRLLNEAATIAHARANVQFDYAVALTEAFKNEEAERVLHRVIELDPNSGPAYVNLGVICERLGKLDEALAICHRGVNLMPQSAQAIYNLANVYLNQGSLNEALQSYDQLLQLDPQFARGHWNRGLTCMLKADFMGGWAGYAWREKAEQVKLDHFDLPLWDGSSLAGKTLLVHAEQGVGDEIMFASCLPEVVQRARHVHVTCDPRLEKLLHRSFPSASVHSVVRGPTFQWKPPADVDLYTHAGTLPYYFRQTWEQFPRQERFLAPEPETVALWRDRFDALGPGAKIGISWRAGGHSSEQRRRTSLLDHWQPLFQIPGVHFVNLQYGEWSEDLAAARARWGVTIHDWEDADPLSDIDGFAAQVAALDAVVSVGNTTIHVAGAVGTPTWTVLPRVPGWRYLLNHDWMPWYGSVRLRRQTTSGDWDEVYARVAEEVEQHLLQVPQRKARRMPLVSPPPAATSSPTSTGVGILPKEKIPEAFLGALKQHRAGRLTEAERTYHQILEQDPHHGDALHLLGVLAHQTRRFDFAIQSIGAAVRIDPANSIYHYNLASALRDCGQVDAAISHLRDAVRLNPHLAEGFLNLGTLLQSQGHYDDAISAYEQALAMRPDYAEAHNNIGSALRDQGRLTQAVECYRRAVSVRPQYADAHLHLAGVLRELGQPTEALVSFDRGLELAPQNAAAHANRAMLRIQQQMFPEGWEEWEWRWQAEGGPHARPFTQPLWQGESLEDKSVLVHMEQGVGDEIMFASCLPDLAANARRLVVECEPRLVSLFQRSFPGVEIHPRESWDRADWQGAAGTFDVQTPAGSLPRRLRSRLSDFPRQRQLLVPDASRARYWRDIVSELGSGLKVGISWRGGFNNYEGRQRSTTLADWQTLAGLDGIEWINLQYGDTAADVAAFEAAWARPLHQLPGLDLRHNLDDLAAAVSNLDLVIGVSNATAHLVGAVGTPMWLLLCAAPSWRWFHGLAESPWYHSVSYVRQRVRGQWDNVFGQVRAQLLKLRHERSADRGAAPAPHFRFASGSSPLAIDMHSDGAMS